MGAVLLATAANDLTLLEVIRERIAEYTRELAESKRISPAPRSSRWRSTA